MGKKIAVLILALAGAGFMAISLPSVIRSLRIKNNGIEAEGNVTATQHTGRKSELDRVTVIFNAGEKGQVITSAMKRGYVNTGQTVSLWYLPDDPLQIDFGDTVRYNMRPVLLGGLFFLFGLYQFLRFVSADISGKKLMQKGKKIQAEVSLARDERFRAGDNNPWIINGIWTDPANNNTYRFKSKLYTIDPSPYLNGRLFIDVYIEPGNPSKYFMDTSFMPEGNYTIG
ncbi:MAG TPA: DUF3592 domain-containing protein [Bacteroidales bacterium]|nr:DUF3592 domain-containing protein [Bacteroidales bacterium]